MAKELFSLAEKIKLLRERTPFTQSELARQMGLTRSSVNAWEMGLSVPSTPYIVELAKTFEVSTDYLLGMEATATISVAGLSESNVALVSELVRKLREKSDLT
ncbi:MAG: helix-turn-helix domain-containing protein [Oscillospiraceae bacterium]|jgi:transcriptional regulator with XRE-family HTH domain|nr:helix-turn-helix domain-containing protein [Oscillospiraceae bacterium]